MTTQNLCDVAKAVLRGKFIAIWPQETRKSSNRQPNFRPKTTTKPRTKNPPKFVEGNKS